MTKPKMIFIGDFNDDGTIELLGAVCDKYHYEYDIVVTGYNYNALEDKVSLIDNCEIVGMSSEKFIYYKLVANIVIIASLAPRYIREKKNQEIIYVVSEFDIKYFAGIIGDITSLITDNKDTYNFFTDSFKHIETHYSQSKCEKIVEIIGENGGLENRNAEDYLFVKVGDASNLRDRYGTSYFLARAANRQYGSLIALTENGGIRDATSNVIFDDALRAKGIISEFGGTVIFYDEASRVFFEDFARRCNITVNELDVLYAEDLKIKLIEDAIQDDNDIEWKEDESKHTKYKRLLDYAYSQNDCNKSKVSIIICRYNTPFDLLERSIASALNCGHENVEVIVIDDGSEESLEGVINKRFSDKRLFYYYKENEGLGLSREYGIKKATGKYVFYLDSDDTIHANGMRYMVSHAGLFNLKMVIGKRILCDEKGVPRSESLNYLAGDCFSCYYGSESEHSIYSDVMVNNLLIEKTFLEKSNVHFRTGLYEDVEYSAQLYRLCPEFHYINIGIHDWYQYGDSSTISSTPSISNLKQRIEKEEYAWKHILEKDRWGRLYTTLTVDFNLYLNAFSRVSEKEREEMWSLIKGYFDEKKKYLTPELYPEGPKEISRAIINGSKNFFDYAVRRYYKSEPTEESYDDYIVFTHYHLYVAILRALERKRPCRLYLGLFYTSFDTNTVYRIKETGIFDLVKTFTYGSIVGNLFADIKDRPGEEDTIIPHHLYNHFADIFRECDTARDVMYIFSDTHPYWYYVEREFNTIIKLEDAYNSFDREVNSHKIAGIWGGIQKYEGTIFPKMFFKSDKIEKIVLSSMPVGIPKYYYDKIVIQDTKELEKKHRSELKDLLLNIYSVDLTLFNEDSVLLLTQPLAQFGYCNQKEQKRLMAIMCKDVDPSNLLIKPHPADTMNYSYLKGRILPRSVTAEVYNYLDVKIDKVITFGSSAIETITFAREKKNYFKLHDIEFDEVVTAIHDIIDEYDKERQRIREEKAKNRTITRRVKRKIKKLLS